MPRTLRVAVCLAVVALLSLAKHGSAHEQHHTHASLARGSVWLLGNPVIDRHAEDLIAQGVVDEDECPNYYSHFYNPRTGANTINPPAVDPNCGVDVNPGDGQTTAPQRAANLWNSAVAQFRAGHRDEAFLLLGHALHLMQDMTSPAHAHNAPHGMGRRSCGQDFDDFETWGWCDDNGTAHIFDYWDATNRRPTDRLMRSLDVLFSRRPQFACAVPDVDACGRSGEPNAAYAFVRRVAELVYDFTSFPVVLVDYEFSADPQPDSELKRMFPSLRDDTGGWAIDNEDGHQNIGFTDGNCGVTELTWPGTKEEWWPMVNPGGGENGPDCFIQEDFVGNNNRTAGNVYIENTGGGGAHADLKVPDDLIPHVYQRMAGGREFYRDLYGTDDNLDAESGFPDPPGKRKSMLRIYGDIMYPIAVVYGAGLIQAFVDEVMPPVVRIDPSPDHLWPPNHKMVPVVLTAQTDPPTPQGPPECRLRSISSDEDPSGPGNKHAPDWTITGVMTAELRAERDGNGDGRDYTLLCDCTYASGRDTVVAVVVPVAHDRGNKGPGDDGPGDDGEGRGSKATSWGVVPHPLHADGTIWFTTDREERVTMSVYDLRGRLVWRPMEGTFLSPGRHEIRADETDAHGNRLPAGVYFLRIESASSTRRGPLIVLQ